MLTPCTTKHHLTSCLLAVKLQGDMCRGRSMEKHADPFHQHQRHQHMQEWCKCGCGTTQMIPCPHPTTSCSTLLTPPVPQGMPRDLHTISQKLQWNNTDHPASLSKSTMIFSQMQTSNYKQALSEISLRLDKGQWFLIGRWGLSYLFSSSASGGVHTMYQWESCKSLPPKYRQLYRFILHKNDLWVVMEFMEGGSLTDIFTANLMTGTNCGHVEGDGARLGASIFIVSKRGDFTIK